ncbi:SDR family NAD(P)-dependent oxidoreductase [Maricaulis sp.]|uniref:SDR family NAD(P)-dependent oxidoreductase n=1 Tax=Maricaulis sp. TaxID=1486257 RepID=UPI0025B89301|nr:SDR family NAD(P)-dependent oxidoreductase [Maricaulis sp.]
MTETRSPRKVLILGALSAMAAATARRLADRGSDFVITGRNADALERAAKDLKARGAASVAIQTLDLLETGSADAVMAQAVEAMGGLDTVLVFYGILGNQAQAETDPQEAERIIAVNYSSAVHWVMAGARALEAQSGPNRVLLTASSVAGDRGRRSNYVYGSAKAGLSVLMQGLAHKWAAQENAPRAVNLKLGFVDTPMTDGIEKGGPLWAKPDDIAAIAERALTKGGPNVYAPWFWRFIMLAIRGTPAFVFNKVNL